MRIAFVFVVAVVGATWPREAAADACQWGFPVGDVADSPAPLADNHPVGGMNLPAYGTHLGGDYWSGGGCTDLGQPVYAVADGVVVEIVDDLGSYLDVVVIEHDDPLAGVVYSMYGHIAREPGLVEGQSVVLRQSIGTIANVLAYFSPCHLHFELLDEVAFAEGPFCNGCDAAGYHVSPGYDRQAGIVEGVGPGGDPWLEVVDEIDGNAWYRTDEFIAARLEDRCGSCGDGVCDPGEDCPDDCAAGESSTSTSLGDGSDVTSDGSGANTDIDTNEVGSAGDATTGPEATNDASSDGPTGLPALPGGARGPTDASCACSTPRDGDRPPAFAWLLLALLARVKRSAR